MSHFTTCRLKLTDQAALVAALEECGFKGKVEVHATPQTLYGYHGDARPERAHVIVRRQYVGSASNDLGFLRSQDGTFTAIVSEFDRGKYSDAWLRKLTTLAGVHRAMAVAKARGHTVERRVDAKGRMQLVVRGRF